MTRVLLVRHGEVDGSQLNAEGWWGPARDLSPLSARGIEQAKAAGLRLRDCGAGRIVASPMTRAMQTASLIAAETRLPLTAVEFDLREWLPDATLSWRSAEAIAASDDFHRHGGEWPRGETRTWEPQSSVRRRALGALHRQAAVDDEPVRCRVPRHGDRGAHGHPRRGTLRRTRDQLAGRRGARR